MLFVHFNWPINQSIAIDVVAHVMTGEGDGRGIEKCMSFLRIQCDA